MSAWVKWTLALLVAVLVMAAVTTVLGAQRAYNDARTSCMERTVAGLACP